MSWEDQDRVSLNLRRSKAATEQNAKNRPPWMNQPAVQRSMPKRQELPEGTRAHRLWHRRCIRCGVSDVELGWRELHHGICTGGLDV